MKTPDIKDLGSTVSQGLDDMKELVEFVIDSIDDIHIKIQEQEVGNLEAHELLANMIAEAKEELAKEKEEMLNEIKDKEEVEIKVKLNILDSIDVVRENIKQNNDTIVENIDHVQQQVDDIKEELQQFKSMKFFARLKWLFTGKVK